MSFRNLRASDIKNNPRVVLPRPRHAKEEAELATRGTMVKQEYRAYVQKQPEPPKVLTASEHRGVQKLKGRIARGEITVCETDKSSGIAIISGEVWEGLGDCHTSGDRVIDWNEVEKDQRIIKGHLRCLNHVFRPGANSGNEERVWNAIELKSTVIALLYPLIKDHKPPRS